MLARILLGMVLAFMAITLISLAISALSLPIAIFLVIGGCIQFRRWIVKPSSSRRPTS